jgi:hypothetical protein
VVLIYAVSVFFGAFLLFAVQPLMGRFILPWFGGSPEVWTTCMLFFQVVLLAGYLYAHLVASSLSVRLQAIVHTLLVVAAVSMLNIVPADTFKPDADANPILSIMVILNACVGLPFFLLSSTGPLMQAWFSRVMHGKSPYRLYSLSNAGSLLALLGYPFVIEPLLGRYVQAKAWGMGLWIFGFVSIVCAAELLACGRRSPITETDAKTDGEGAGVPLRRRFLWMVLSAGSCVVLLAVTNKICQDITVIPFFWVLPLSVYLLSFIICFHSERWYIRNVWAAGFIVSFAALIGASAWTNEIPAGWYIAIHVALLFSCCMVFHGELYTSRPESRHLTGYYLMIAAGGALGGVFVVVLAPVIFNSYFELYVGLLMCCLSVLLRQRAAALSRRRRVVWVCLVVSAGAAGFVLQDRKFGITGRAVASERNFFGVLSVWEEDAGDPAMHRFVMQHGSTKHGLQFADAARRDEPTAYYGRTSGIGYVMESLSNRANLRTGAVGLGVGTTAAYGRGGDHLTFYEINPEVKRQAETYFTYLADSRADVDIVLGDGRLSLERQGPQGFDLLVLDAFTSDAVPVHLLTKEAFEIYLRHLKGDGIIALHASTNHVNLQPVVRRIAEHFGLSIVWIEGYADAEKGLLDSDWLIMSRESDLLGGSPISSHTTAFEGSTEVIDLWTDDRVNLLQVLK